MSSQPDIFSQDHELNNHVPTNSPATNTPSAILSGNVSPVNENASPESTGILVSSDDRKKYEDKVNTITESQINMVCLTIKNRLNGLPVSKAVIPQLVASSLLALSKLKNNTAERNGKIVILGLKRYLNTTKMSHDEKVEMILGAESAVESGMFLYETYKSRKDNKSRCVIV